MVKARDDPSQSSVEIRDENIQNMEDNPESNEMLIWVEDHAEV